MLCSLELDHSWRNLSHISALHRQQNATLASQQHGLCLALRDTAGARFHLRRLVVLSGLVEKATAQPQRISVAFSHCLCGQAPADSAHPSLVPGWEQAQAVGTTVPSPPNTHMSI